MSADPFAPIVVASPSGGCGCSACCAKARQPTALALQGSYGAANPLGDFLGALGGSAAGAALQDPAVQEALMAAAGECQTKAEEGVNSWMKKNWPYLLAGGAGIVGLNYVMTMTALGTYLGGRDLKSKRRARREQKAA
jgi:hypothetical protein